MSGIAVVWQGGVAHQIALLLQVHGQHGDMKARHAVWCSIQAMATYPAAQQRNRIIQVRQRSHCSCRRCRMAWQQSILYQPTTAQCVQGPGCL